MKKLAAAIGCLAIVAVLSAASAAAAPVGLIEEFDVDGSAIVLASGPDGNVWFTYDRDFNSPRGSAIGRIDSRGKETLFGSGFRRGSELGDIVLGPDGNLWFTDHGKQPAIGRITPQGAITTFTAGLTPDSKPRSIVAGPDDNLWFTDAGKTPAIVRVTPQGIITEFSAGLTSKSEPGEIIAGADGNLWFNNRSTTAAIGRITPQGEIAEFGPGPVAGGGAEVGPVLGPDGNVWFAIGSYKSLGIGRITPSGAITGFGGISPQTRSLGPFAAGSDGNVWFTARGLEEYDAQGKRVTSGYSTAIGRVTPNGEVTTFGECLHTGPQYTGPNSITAGPDGNVWFTNFTTRSLPNIGTPPGIGRIAPNGQITEYRAGLSYASSPDGIVAGPDGALWFTDRELHSIGRIVPSSAPANTFIVRPAKRARRNGAVVVRVAVPSSGLLTLELRGLLSFRNRLTRIDEHQVAIATALACGDASIPLRLRGVALERLRSYGSIRMKARVSFTPANGSTYTEAVTIGIGLRRR